MYEYKASVPRGISRSHEEAMTGTDKQAIYQRGDVPGWPLSPLSKRWNFFRRILQSLEKSAWLLFVLIALPGTAWAGGWANLQSSSSPSGVYLGDTPTMGTIWVDTTENGNSRSQVEVNAEQGDQNLTSGASQGAILTGNASQAITPSAPQSTSTGTWYWGIRVQYTHGGGNYDAHAWTTGWSIMSFAGFPNDTTSGARVNRCREGHPTTD